MKSFWVYAMIFGLFAAAGSRSYAVTVPQFLNLEGRLTDPEGNPITTRTVVEFRVFWGGSASAGDSGSLKYRETAPITPAADGTYQHKLGGGTVLDGIPLTIETFDTSQPVYLQVNIAGSPLLPRLEFGAMPFAFHAETPTGMISMFETSCPTGWSVFSPLTDRMPIGAGNLYATSSTGGTASHNHSISSDGNHAHTISIDGSHDHGGLTGIVSLGGIRGDGKVGGPDQEPTTVHTHGISSDGSHNHGGSSGFAGAHDHSGITGNTSTLPPYLGVVFCQKQ